MTHKKIYNIGRPLKKKQQVIPPPQSQMRLIHYYGLYIETADYGCHLSEHLSCCLGLFDLK